MNETPLSEFDVEEDATTAALTSVFDFPVTAAPKGLEQKTAEHHSLAADTRALPIRQRMFLRALLANSMRPDVARRACGSAGVKIDHHTTASWMRKPAFKSIIDRYAQLMIEQAGIGSPAHILLRIDAVVEDALQPVTMYWQGVPLRDADGNVQKEVDRGSALKGLEMLGKASGTFRKDEENSQRVTVILDFSGEQMQGEQESEVIEGEVVR